MLKELMGSEGEMLSLPDSFCVKDLFPAQTSAAEAVLQKRNLRHG
jgi:hypothetical protein